eukprot:537687_1
MTYSKGAFFSVRLLVLALLSSALDALEVDKFLVSKGPPSDSLFSLLKQNRALWNSHKPGSAFHFKVTHTRPLSPPLSEKSHSDVQLHPVPEANVMPNARIQPNTATTRDGKLVFKWKIFQFDDTARISGLFPSDGSPNLGSIDSLFNFIESSLQRDPDVAHVKFDDTVGFPRVVRFQFPGDSAPVHFSIRSIERPTPKKIYACRELYAFPTVDSSSVWSVQICPQQENSGRRNQHVCLC